MRNDSHKKARAERAFELWSGGLFLRQGATTFHTFIQGFEFGEFLGALVAGAFGIMANAAVRFFHYRRSWGSCSLACRQFAATFEALIHSGKRCELLGIAK